MNSLTQVATPFATHLGQVEHAPIGLRLVKRRGPDSAARERDVNDRASAAPLLVRPVPRLGSRLRVTMVVDLVAAATTVLIANLAGLPLGVMVSTVVPPLWLLLLAESRAYEGRHLEVGRAARALRVLRAGCTLVVACWGLAMFAGVTPTATQLLLVGGGVTTSCLLPRVGVDWWATRGGRAGDQRTRVVVAGHRAEVARVLNELRRTPGHSFEVVSVCLARTHKQATFDVPVSIGFDTLDEAAFAVGAEAVIVLPCRHFGPAQLRRLGWELEKSGTHLYVGTPLLDVAASRTTVAHVGGLRMLHVRPVQRLGPARLVKAAADRAVAFLALLVLLPVLLAVALAIRWDSPGPVIFRQARVGRHGRSFTMYKFRTMEVDADPLDPFVDDRNDTDGLLFKLRRDPRVTRLGKVLRRYSVDEVPQLVNIMLGQMSLVGPRPALPTEVVRYDHDPQRRLVVKPGLTGLWQVSGRSDLSWEDSVRLDLRYVDNWSLSLDVAILCRTIGAVLTHRGAY